MFRNSGNESQTITRSLFRLVHSLSVALIIEVQSFLILPPKFAPFHPAYIFDNPTPIFFVRLQRHFSPYIASSLPQGSLRGAEVEVVGFRPPASGVPNHNSVSVVTPKH